MSESTKTMPKQFRVLPETAQAIDDLREKTGKGTADILKAWQLAFEKVGSDEEGKDIVKSRINAVQGHFVAVIAELEAMAQDLQAHHETDSQKIKELQKKNEEQAEDITSKTEEINRLNKRIADFEKIGKGWEEEHNKLTAEIERLKNVIVSKLESK